jgi:putative PIN family toxin of toxin-antitoxin system
LGLREPKQNKRGMLAAVIDTNVWVSAFLNPSGFPARLIQAGKIGRFQIISSLPMLDELSEVLLRPRLMRIRQVTEDDVEAFVAGVGAVVRLAPVSGDLRLCRDPDDDIVLETAVRGGATYLVSRDLDLITQLHQRDIEIITVQRFLHLLSAGAGEAG